MTLAAAAVRPREAARFGLWRRPRASVRAALIRAVGLVLRLATLTRLHAYFPDEVFQYLEAAHRLAFGPGVVTWEYREHVRSWLVPLALAGPMRLGDMISPHSGAYILLPKLGLLAISMATIPAAGLIGRRFSALHALLAMLVAGTSAEFVYFSTIALTEPLAGFLFLIAAAQLYRRVQPSKQDLIAAGALLTLTCLVRFQYGPSVVILGLATLSRGPRRIGWLLVGSLPLLALSSALDLSMGDRPFAWLAANIHQNITLGRSHAWVDGPFYYLQTLIEVWGAWLAPLLVLAIIGARRCPALFIAALANLLIHTMIAHKEYRYILLTTMTMAVLAAIGTAETIRWARRHSAPGRWKHIIWIAVGGWLAASASIATSGPMQYWWDQQQNQLSAFASVRDQPDLCGVAIFGFDWTGSGGYAYLHRSVPLFAYALTERSQMQHDIAQFDAIVTPAQLPTPAAFSQERCIASPGRTTMCIRTRPGRCVDADSPAEINRQLIRTNR